MDYAKELRELLRPLGLYQVDAGISGAELGSIGAELDMVWAALERAEQDANPLTATEDGLARWEALLPFVPASRSAAERRRAVAALLRIDGAGFTAAAINGTLAGCGIPAAVRESGAAQTVEVVFPGTRGVPEGFEPGLRQRIEQILPCHLEIRYAFTYLRWTEFSAYFADWEAVEAVELPWVELEKLGETEA